MSKVQRGGLIEVALPKLKEFGFTVFGPGGAGPYRIGQSVKDNLL
jgi:hypothetical protein